MGIIKEVAHNEYSVTCKYECGPNQFKWPNQTDSCQKESVICTIKGPIPANNLGVFQLFDGNFEKF